MARSTFVSTAWILLWCLSASPAIATDVDLMGVEVEGVRLGMSLNEATAALENRDYERPRPRSFQKRDRDGMHYVGLKLNPGDEVVSVEVAHFLDKAIEPDVVRDQWIEKWGEPDRRVGNVGHDWNLHYNADNAVLETRTKKSAFRGKPHEVRVRLAAKGQVLAVRRGHEVSEKICTAIKDKPVSMLNVQDRNNLLECLRTGRLRIVAP